MGEIGLFQDRRVELIDGEIVHMSPPLSLHSGTVGMVERLLLAAFGGEYWVRTQMPLRLHADSEPEPDLAVVEGEPRSYLKDHPKCALLVVEVSESSLAFDRGPKGSLYASAGIADYWIVNLIDHCLDVYRNPIADPAAAFGSRYAAHQKLCPGDRVAPLAKSEARLAVADLRP